MSLVVLLLGSACSHLISTLVNGDLKHERIGDLDLLCCREKREMVFEKIESLLPVLSEIRRYS